MKAEDEYRKVVHDDSRGRRYNRHDSRREERRREREISPDDLDSETGLNEKEKQAIRVSFYLLMYYYDYMYNSTLNN